ncbi:MAG TPA: MmgE/PrpD family protein [Kofleriaceae bacterium]|nr:MmgE/PrpD family protein [Kofleriaceae bacterium]
MRARRYFIHLVGAAAAAAHLLGLDAERATHALAIPLAQPPLALQPAFFEPTSRFLAAAVPTQIGVQAAYFARAGMTGAPRILEDRKGFWMCSRSIR